MGLYQTCNDVPPSEEFFWFYSLQRDQDNWIGPYKTRDEALFVALKEAEEDGYSFLYLLEASFRPLRNDIFDAVVVLEDFVDVNSENLDPDGSSLDGTVPPKQLDELEAMLTAAFKQWREKYKVGAPWAFLKKNPVETVPVFHMPKEHEIKE